MKGRSNSVSILMNLTETHKYPHRVIPCIQEKLEHFVRFVSVIFY